MRSCTLSLAVKSLVFASFVLGCAGSTTQQALVKEKWKELLRAHSRDSIFVVRYNPANCDVPENEVLLDGRWYRVRLLPDRPVGVVATLNEKLRKRALQGQPGVEVQVLGRLADDVREAPNLALYLELEVEQECVTEKCPGARKQQQQR